jgi:hypothetical protein
MRTISVWSLSVSITNQITIAEQAYSGTAAGVSSSTQLTSLTRSSNTFNFSNGTHLDLTFQSSPGSVTTFGQLFDTNDSVSDVSAHGTDLGLG